MTKTPDISPKQISYIRTRLLQWYRHNRRDLPWRGETDPYRIWVSEVMLQQTQVTTVIPYYHKFLKKFPTVADLAAAPLDEVLKAWEGLGYYARARNLHRAAAEIIEQHDGQLPMTYADLRKLPGFGEYTAGAVASIAFAEAVPAVDGNVRRVLARLFALNDDVRQGSAARHLKALAAELAAPDAPADWTQAVMELGALLCLPQSPKCLLCPLNDVCQGRLQGIEQELPIKPPKKKRPHYDVAAAVIRRGQQILIAQRPVDSMLGGMWEFPGGKQEAGETLPECARREIKEELGIDIAVGRQLTAIDHGYTHFKITLHAFECEWLAGEPQALEVADWRWVTLDTIADFPFPRTDQKIIELLRQQAEAAS